MQLGRRMFAELEMAVLGAIQSYKYPLLAAFALKTELACYIYTDRSTSVSSASSGLACTS